MRVFRGSVVSSAFAIIIGTGFSSLGLVSPAFAADCTPTSTSSWTGDGTHGSSVGTIYSVVQFSTVGTCTWTVPGGVPTIAALAVGAGGGGGGGSGAKASGISNSGAAGAGGGGGNISFGSGVVTPGQNLTIVVGAGGSSGAGKDPGIADGCGGQGGSSSIAEISLSAAGGNGGTGGGQNAACTADNKDTDGFFLPGNGGDSGSGMIGGSPSAPQAGQGASVSTNGAATTAINTATSTSFAGISATYGSGGGGGSRGANYGSRDAAAGSGGGGGREPQYFNVYYYGYGGSAGRDGTVIVRYIPPISVTASTPATIVLGQSIPAISFSSSPATTAGDWTIEPTCAVYSSDDLSTALTVITQSGTYVTQCSGGQLTNGGGATFTAGSFVVDPVTVTASSPASIKVGDTLPTVTFTTSPEGYTPDWTTEPTCGIYSSSDLTTPLTAITAPGTYVTHCTGGVLSNGASGFTFADGTLVVAPADSGGGGDNGGGDNKSGKSSGGPLAMTGWAIATTLALIVGGIMLFTSGFGMRGVRSGLVTASQNDRLREVLRELNTKLSNLEKKPRRRP